MADPVQTIQETTNIVNSISSLLIALAAGSTALIGFCAVVSALFPPPDPDSKFYPVLKVLRTIINHIGANVKHAKNKE